MRLLMIGAPGVGKGSQATRISKKLSIPHISTGDLFREQIAANSIIGQKVSSYINQGTLVPDEITVDILAERLANEDCQNGFVLDGFPRTVQQAHSLDKLLTQMNIAIDAVVNISLDDLSIVRRITGRRTCSSCASVYHIEDQPSVSEGLCDHCSGNLINRSDDTPGVIKQRLDIYHDKTKPLIEYYMNKVKFVQIESDKQITVTTQKVFEALGITV